MSDTEDSWPRHYNPGPHSHLHAIGVIGITFASLEGSIDVLYLDRARRENMPTDLINLYYFSLNEETRLKAINTIFAIYEKDEAIKDCVSNMVAYFAWCRNCRNQILHAELYPASLGGKKGVLYLTKRLSKQSPQSGYMRFKLRKLRYIADRIRKGVVQCAEIHLYLSFHGYPTNTIPQEMRVYARTLPKKLRIPQTLALDPHP